jgi:hypothetical protein
LKKFFMVMLMIQFAYWGVGFEGARPSAAESVTHTVQKGDTLWDICEYYYGDPNLWPKLWQMNSFVTNPHLLEEGDVITLLEGIPVGKEADAAESGEMTEDSMRGDRGRDVSGLTNVNSMGYFSRQERRSCGQIISGETPKLILAEGDKIFVELADGYQGKPGDVFTVYKNSPQLKDPLSNEFMGYVVSFLGRVVLTEHVEKNLYKGKVAASYRALRVGDSFFPFQPVSPCVKLLPGDPRTTARVIAVKENHRVIGQFTVVYIDQGFNQGIQRGNVFGIVEQKKVEVRRDSAVETVDLPDIDLGQILIIESRPDSATGVVRATRTDIRTGNLLKELDWDSVMSLAPRLPQCALE